MPNAKVEFDRVNSYLIKWITEISINNAQIYFDINRVSEGTSAYLLNLLFDYHLIDLNDEKQNMPGIDLGDKEISKFAFQITSRTDLKKIKNALETFVSKEYIKSYPNGLKFLILSNQKLPHFSESLKLKYQGFFDPKNDILKVNDLMVQVKNLYYKDYKKFAAVRDFLEKEFSSEVNKGSNSLMTFYNIEHKIQFFKQVYSANQRLYTEKFIPIEYISKNQSYFSNQITDEKWDNDGLIILGPSGCGKSALAKLISIELIETVFPIFLQAKYYDDGIQSMFTKEVCAYNFDSVAEFLKIAKDLNQRILLILDGLNECSNKLQSKLIIELSKISKDQNFLVIITTQVQSNILEELGYKEISIQKPSQEICEAIVVSYGRGIYDIDLNSVLSAISTGLEAKMIGEIGFKQGFPKSRHNLFSSFIKLKLKQVCIESFQLMSLIAGTMSERITFSLPTRVVENILLENSITSQILDECFKSGILEERNRKLSFGHEMFFNFFVAESVIRFSNNSKDIITAINEPKNNDKKILIIGAMDDESQIIELLKFIEDQNIFDQLVNGDGGDFCQLWVQNQIIEILPKLSQELERSEFCFSEELEIFEIKSDSLNDWTKKELALIMAIQGQLLNGFCLEKLLDIISRMDDICFTAVNKFWNLGEENRISVRSSVFHSAYIDSWGKQTVLTQLFSNIHSGFFNNNKRLKISKQELIKLIENKKLKFGQIYLLLLLFRWNSLLNTLYSYALNSLQTWRHVPYYLISEFLTQIRYLFNNDQEKRNLVEAIKKMHSETKNIWLSTNIFDALSSLGELEDDSNEYLSVVIDEIDNILLYQNDEGACEKAAVIYFCQFDHPYSAAYIDTIQELSPNKKVKFYEMALQASHNALFTISLILDAHKVIGSKSLQYITKWTKSPFETVSFPQDSLALYLLAFLILGKSDYPLPEINISNLEEKNKSIRLLAEICYFHSLSDIKYEEKGQKIEDLSSQFFNLDNRFLLDTVWQFKFICQQKSFYIDFDFQAVYNIDNIYKAEIVFASRKALHDLNWQGGIFFFKKDKIELNQNAILILGILGSILDIELLRNFTSDQNYGKYAVEAIKKISERT
ncbi:SMEK domain-containing protein [Sphingobacterium anhuiense]|uniref:SMEK domain-containing protein n=1 Tax=Sphingobacterium anhuiense TaxID=493780 RepID=A0ABW5YW72_9SPHI